MIGPGVGIVYAEGAAGRLAPVAGYQGMGGPNSPAAPFFYCAGKAKTYKGAKLYWPSGGGRAATVSPAISAAVPA